MRKALFAVSLLILSTLACTITFTPAPPANPTEFIQVVYQYEDNGQSGLNFAFLVDTRPDFSSAISFDGDPFTVETLVAKQAVDPYQGFTIKITDSEKSNPFEGTSDETGHGYITVPYTSLKVSVSGWYCQQVGSWPGETNESGFPSEGGMFRCER